MRIGSLLLAAICLAGLSSLAGCANALGSGDASSAAGTLLVRLSMPAASASSDKAPGPSATILPDFPALIDSVSVTLSASGQASQTRTSTSSSADISFTGLPAAYWAISVKVYHSGVEIGSGSANASVGMGSTSSASVPIAFSKGSGSGDLKILIAWPSDTGVNALKYSIDGSASSEAAVAPSGSDYQATITATGLSAAAGHRLTLDFFRVSTATTSAGVFVEAVNIYTGLESVGWIDSTGSIKTSMRLSKADFFETNANLGGLVIADAISGAEVPIGFSSLQSPSEFYAKGMPPSGSIVVKPVPSMDGQRIAYTWNGVTPSTAWSSLLVSTSLLLNTLPKTNALVINVTAPDGATTKTYFVYLNYGDALVSLAAPVSYAALGFPSAASIMQGQAFALETGDAALSAVASGWTWYLDGVLQAESSRRFVLSPIATQALSGIHIVTGIVKSGAVSYSGRCVLTVTRRVALGFTSSSSFSDLSLATTLSAPYDICYYGGKLYVADLTNHRVVAADLDGANAYVLAGDSSKGGNVDGVGAAALFVSPIALACDGSYLYVGDHGNYNVRRIDLATAEVTTLAGDGVNAYHEGVGTGAGYVSPDGIWTDGTTLYVCDRGAGKLSAIDLATKVARTLGTAAWNGPYRVCGDGAYLYVTEYSSGKVRKFDLSTMIPTDIASGFDAPAGILYDGGDLYVLDADNDSGGYPIVRLGTDGTNTSIIASGFTYPKGITSDGTSIYVANSGVNAIRRVH